MCSPGVDNPLANAVALARAVALGIFDAPHLRNNPFALNQVHMGYVDSACVTVDVAGRPISVAGTGLQRPRQRPERRDPHNFGISDVCVNAPGR